jgi:hypothetical protein
MLPLRGHGLDVCLVGGGVWELEGSHESLGFVVVAHVVDRDEIVEVFVI